MTVKRRINSTTQVLVKSTAKGYKITVIGGEFDGKSTTMTEAVALDNSPNSVINPRAMGRAALRRFRERSSS